MCFCVHMLKLFTLLDLCVPSLRRGHAICSVLFQFQRTIPEGNPTGSERELLLLLCYVCLLSSYVYLVYGCCVIIVLPGSEREFSPLSCLVLLGLGRKGLLCVDVFCLTSLMCLFCDNCVVFGLCHLLCYDKFDLLFLFYFNVSANVCLFDERERSLLLLEGLGGVLLVRMECPA